MLIKVSEEGRQNVEVLKTEIQYILASAIGVLQTFILHGLGKLASSVALKPVAPITWS